MEKFKQIVDVLMRYHVAYPELTVFGKHIDHEILSIEFGENLLVIRKKMHQHALHSPNVPGAPTNLQNIQAWERQAQASNV